MRQSKAWFMTTECNSAIFISVLVSLFLSISLNIYIYICVCVCVCVCENKRIPSRPHIVFKIFILSSIYPALKPQYYGNNKKNCKNKKIIFFKPKRKFIYAHKITNDTGQLSMR